jgi:hypothetical protein
MLGICLFTLDAEYTGESLWVGVKGGRLSPPTNPASLAFVLGASFALRSILVIAAS